MSKSADYNLEEKQKIDDTDYQEPEIFNGVPYQELSQPFMENIIKLDIRLEELLNLGLYELATWVRNERDYQVKELYV